MHLRKQSTTSQIFPSCLEVLGTIGKDPEIPTVTYNEFLKDLKTACVAIGSYPSLFATHSLRRGTVSDQFANGVPDKVIKYARVGSVEIKCFRGIYRSCSAHWTSAASYAATKVKKLGIGKLASIIEHDTIILNHTFAAQNFVHR
jgi:hypothetical protein